MQRNQYNTNNETLVCKIQAGHEEYIALLWANLQRYIKAAAIKYYNRFAERFRQYGVEVDDLYQVGFFALLNAIEAYNPDRGYKFTTYLTYPLKNQFNALMGVRGGKVTKAGKSISCSVSSSTLLSDDEDGGLTIEDTIADDTAEFVDGSLEKIYTKKLREDLETALDNINPRQAAAVRCVYFKEPDKYNNHKSAKYAYAAKGLEALRVSDVLQEYKDDIITTRAYRGGNEWYSSVEATIIMLERMGYLRNGLAAHSGH